MRFISIPDSSEETLSSSQIYAVMDEEIKKHFPDNRTVSIPVADGGGNSADTSITAVGGVKEYAAIKDPYFEGMKFCFGLVSGGQTVIIEMAPCARPPLVGDRKDPRLTTTYGVGQLILTAAGKGVKKIIMSLGGSSTNDGSRGVAAAVGIGFYDRSDRELIPTGGTTVDIDRIGLSGRDSLLEQVEIITMYDIDNSMYGPAGASFILGSRKGADEAMAPQLDEGTRNLSGAIAQATGTDIGQVPGAGAARAMGAGMIAFFGSRLQMGTQTVLDTAKFDEIIGDADYILIGEGKLDSRSLRDEVVVGVAKKANKQVKAVIAVVGGADDGGIGRAYDMGVAAMFPTNRFPQDFSVSRHCSQESLVYTVDNITRLIKAGQGEH